MQPTPLSLTPSAAGISSVSSFCQPNFTEEYQQGEYGDGCKLFAAGMYKKKEDFGQNGPKKIRPRYMAPIHIWSSSNFLRLNFPSLKPGVELLGVCQHNSSVQTHHDVNQQVDICSTPLNCTTTRLSFYHFIADNTSLYPHASGHPASHPTTTLALAFLGPYKPTPLAMTFQTRCCS